MNTLGERLAGRAGVITGGASGIGRAGAIRFAAEGASLIVLDTDATAGHDCASVIRARGGSAEFMEGDCSHEPSVKAAVDRCVGEYGHLDLLWANAAIGVAKTVPETTIEEWNRVVDVNLGGPFLLAKYGIPPMVAHGGGTMIITGSVNCFYADAQWAVYCVTKGGLLMLCRALAIDHAKDRVRVNILCPGAVETPLHEAWLRGTASAGGYEALREKDRLAHPMERIGTPEEVAAAALFLATDESSFCTGSTLFVDGGFSAT